MYYKPSPGYSPGESLLGRSVIGAAFVCTCFVPRSVKTFWQSVTPRLSKLNKLSLEWRKVSKLLKKGERRNRFAPLDVMSTKTSKWEEASKKNLYARTGPANLDWILGFSIIPVCCKAFYFVVLCGTSSGKLVFRHLSVPTPRDDDQHFPARGTCEYYSREMEVLL